MSLLQQLHNLAPIHLTSYSFLFVFLPLSLFVYYSVPQRWRAGVLFLTSLLYYVQAQPRSFSLLLIILLLDFAALWCMATFDSRESIRKICATFSVVKTIGLLIWVGSLERSVFVGMGLGLPIYSLTATGCVLAAYRRSIPYERNFTRFGACCSFYPALYTGPLTAYDTFSSQLKQSTPNLQHFLTGMSLLIIGVFKHAVFGRELFMAYTKIRALPFLENTVLSLWSMVLLLALSTYYTLSGFSDIARGVGSLYGFQLPQNYYYPFQSRSIQDFFQRFNSTFTHYLENNLPLPNTKSAFTQAIYMLFYAFLFGLWFGLQPSFWVWGLFLGILVILEHFIFLPFRQQAPILFCRALTFLCVLFSFAILLSDTPLQLFQIWIGMFGLGGLQTINENILYILSSNWFLIICAGFFATSGASLAISHLRKTLPKFANGIMIGIDTIVLILFLAYTV